MMKKITLRLNGFHLKFSVILVSPLFVLNPAAYGGNSSSRLAVATPVSSAPPASSVPPVPAQPTIDKLRSTADAAGEAHQAAVASYVAAIEMQRREAEEKLKRIEADRARSRELEKQADAVRAHEEEVKRQALSSRIELLNTHRDRSLKILGVVVLPGVYSGPVEGTVGEIYEEAVEIVSTQALIQGTRIIVPIGAVYFEMPYPGVSRAQYGDVPGLAPSSGPDFYSEKGSILIQGSKHPEPTGTCAHVRVFDNPDLPRKDQWFSGTVENFRLGKRTPHLNEACRNDPSTRLYDLCEDFHAGRDMTPGTKLFFHRYVERGVEVGSNFRLLRPEGARTLRVTRAVSAVVPQPPVPSAPKAEPEECGNPVEAAGTRRDGLDGEAVFGEPVSALYPHHIFPEVPTFVPPATPVPPTEQPVRAQQGQRRPALVGEQ